MIEATVSAIDTVLVLYQLLIQNELYKLTIGGELWTTTAREDRVCPIASSTGRPFERATSALSLSLTGCRPWPTLCGLPRHTPGRGLKRPAAGCPQCTPHAFGDGQQQISGGRRRLSLPVPIATAVPPPLAVVICRPARRKVTLNCLSYKQSHFACFTNIYANMNHI